jgi:hypothetical protein
VTETAPYLVVLRSLVQALEAGDEAAATAYGAALSKLVETRPSLSPAVLTEAQQLQAKAELLAAHRLEEAARDLELGSTAARAARLYGNQP